MSADDAREIIRTIREEVEAATDVMLSAAERGLRDLGAARAGQGPAFDRLEQLLCAILEACAFQDITGQRVSRLEELIGTVSVQLRGDDELLNGPAMPGAGLDQVAANRLIGDAP